VGVRYDSQIEVSGVAKMPLTLAFPPASVTEFVASTTKLLSTRSRRRTGALARIVLDDPVGGGALSFSRRVNGKTTVYRFYFSDAFGTGFPITASAAETRSVLNALRTAVTASRRLDRLSETPSAPRKPAPVRRKRPAPKQPAGTRP